MASSGRSKIVGANNAASAEGAFFNKVEKLSGTTYQCKLGDSGKVFLVASADILITLPAASKSTVGWSAKFIFTVDPSGSFQRIHAAAATSLMVGRCFVARQAEPGFTAAPGGAHYRLTFNDAGKGGTVVGDTGDTYGPSQVIIRGLAGNLWFVDGSTTCAHGSAQATPFS